MAKIQDVICDICGGSVRKDAQPLDKDKAKLTGTALGKTVEDACFNCKRYIDSFATAFKYLKSGGKDAPAKKEVAKKPEVAPSVPVAPHAGPAPALNSTSTATAAPRPELKVVPNTQPGTKVADSTAVPNGRA